MKKKRSEGSHWRHGIRDGFTANGEVACANCFQLRRKIEELRDENVRLKAALKRQNKSVTTPALVAPPSTVPQGAHTPSSQRRWKRNTTPENVLKRGGARTGHQGHGRLRFGEQDAHRTVEVHTPEVCKDCLVKLQAQGSRTRSALETQHLQVEKVTYRLHGSRCSRCGKTYRGQAPLLPRALYGNSLLAKMLVMHFEHGVTLGRTCQVLGDGIHLSGVINAFHRVAKFFSPALDIFIDAYRKSPVRHADETGWRIDGLGAWAWIFCTELVSIFHYCRTRSGSVPLQILGPKKLSGILVVDRFSGYNKAPCQLQYCYAHLLRDVLQLERDFPDSTEVVDLVQQFAPLLRQAMQLPDKAPADRFALEAEIIAKQIQDSCSAPSRHFAVCDIKNIFLKNEHRLYHWTSSPNIPAHNNRAEREIRRTVIARKTSFASQSELGATSRGILQSVIATAKKNVGIEHLELWIHHALNSIAKNSSFNISLNLPAITKINANH